MVPEVPAGAYKIRALQVHDVKCGAYHTCIISKCNRLWCCGRDWTVCEGEHVQTATLFDKGALGSAVDLVSVGAHHTAVITKKGSLYVWGDNLKGQLGIGHFE